MNETKQPGDRFESDRIRDELNELAPGLSSMRKAEVPSPPPGYFESLADRVVARAQEPQAKVRRFNLVRIASAAAAVLLIVAVAMWLVNPKTATNGDVSAEALIEYVELNVDDYLAGDLIALLDDETIDEFMPAVSDDEALDALDVLLDDIDDETLNTFLELQNSN